MTIDGLNTVNLSLMLLIQWVLLWMSLLLAPHARACSCHHLAGICALERSLYVNQIHRTEELKLARRTLALILSKSNIGVLPLCLNAARHVTPPEKECICFGLFL